MSPQFYCLNDLILAFIRMENKIKHYFVWGGNASKEENQIEMTSLFVWENGNMEQTLC